MPRPSASDDFSARLLSRTGTPVVDLPGSSYPSIVLSGDDLNRFVVDARRALALLYSGDGEACAYMLDDVVERLMKLRSDYECTLREAGRLTPYVPGRDRL